MKKGFTLMELLIVIAIIGILVSIAAASYITAQKQSRDSRRVSDMKSMQNAWEQYFADNNANYAGTEVAASCSLDSLGSPDTYLPGGFPTDPKTSTAFYPTKDGWSRCSTTSYCFCAGIELAKNQNSAVDCANLTSAEYPNGFYCVNNLQ